MCIRDSHLDRVHQWDRVEQAIAAGGTRVLFLPGAQGEAHGHFVSRLLRCHPQNALPVDVRWPDPRPPSNLADYAASLVPALVEVAWPERPLSDADHHTLAQA